MSTSVNLGNTIHSIKISSMADKAAWMAPEAPDLASR